MEYTGNESVLNIWENVWNTISSAPPNGVSSTTYNSGLSGPAVQIPSKTDAALPRHEEASTINLLELKEVSMNSPYQVPKEEDVSDGTALLPIQAIATNASGDNIVDDLFSLTGQYPTKTEPEKAYQHELSTDPSDIKQYLSNFNVECGDPSYSTETGMLYAVKEYSNDNTNSSTEHSLGKMLFTTEMLANADESELRTALTNPSDVGFFSGNQSTFFTESSEILQRQLLSNVSTPDSATVDANEPMSGMAGLYTNNDGGGYKCKQCRNSFITPLDLVRHSRVHFNIDRHVCHICLKRYSTVANLSEHYITHTGVKPFECNLCGAKFTQQSSLSRHRRKHVTANNNNNINNNNVVSPAAGEINKVYAAQSSISPHSKFDGNVMPNGAQKIECNECGKSFLRKGNYERHMETHDKRKLLNGNVTMDAVQGGNFNQRTSLQSKSNDDERIECGECGKVFFKRKNFMKHRRLHEKRKLLMAQKLAESNSSNEVSSSFVSQGNEVQSSFVSRANEVQSSFANANEAPRNDAQFQINTQQSTFAQSYEIPNNNILTQQSSFLPYEISNHVPNDTLFEINTQPNTFVQPSEINTQPSTFVQPPEISNPVNDNPFACTPCGRSFTNRRNFSRHNKVHHPQKVVKSPESFDGKLEESINAVASAAAATVEKTYIHQSPYPQNADYVTVNENICNICGKGFLKRRNLQRHLKVHEMQEQLASQEYARRMQQNNYDEAQIHAQAYAQQPSTSPHSEKNEQFQCNDCLKIFYKRRNIVRHVKIHDVQRERTLRTSTESMEKVQVEASKMLEIGEKPHSCPYCKKCFVRSANYERHLELHKSLNDQVAGDFPPNISNDLMKSKRIQCQECGLEFADDFQLTQHWKLHVRKYPHTCSDCRLHFMDNSSFHRHMLIHNTENLYQCAQCGKQFLTEAYLLQHVSIHFSGKFECSICNLEFKSQEDLTLHIEIHKMVSSEEQNVLSTSTFQDIKSETQSNEEPLNEVPEVFDDILDMQCNSKYLTSNFICNICKSEFSNDPELVAHLKGHNVEEMRESNENDLDSTQSRIKSNQCAQCGRLFLNAVFLEQHMTMHHSLLDFQCNFCTEQFSSELDLNLHLKMHNNSYSNEPFSIPALRSESELKVESGLIPETQLDSKKNEPNTWNHWATDNVNQGINFSNESNVNSTITERVLSDSAGIFVEESKSNPLVGFTDSVLHSHKADGISRSSELKREFSANSELILDSEQEWKTTAHGIILKPPQYDSNSLLNDVDQKPILSELYPGDSKLQPLTTIQNIALERQLIEDDRLLSDKISLIHRLPEQNNSFIHPTQESSDNPYSNESQFTVLDNQQEHVCAECKKSFANVAELIDHIERECSKCNEKFPNLPLQRFKKARRPSLKTNQNLSDDAKFKHRSRHRAQCSVCARVFFDQSTLNVHLVRMHKLLPFKCPHCDARFLRKKLLLEHCKIHGDDVISCSICFKQCPDQASLTIHLMTHSYDEKFPNMARGDEIGIESTQPPAQSTIVQNSEVAKPAVVENSFENVNYAKRQFDKIDSGQTADVKPLLQSVISSENRNENADCEEPMRESHYGEVGNCEEKPSEPLARADVVNENIEIMVKEENREAASSQHAERPNNAECNEVSESDVKLENDCEPVAETSLIEQPCLPSVEDEQKPNQSKESLDESILERQTKPDVDESQSQITANDSSLQDDRLQYKCERCDSEFSHMSKLRFHMKAQNCSIAESVDETNLQADGAEQQSSSDPPSTIEDVRPVYQCKLESKLRLRIKANNENKPALKIKIAAKSVEADRSSTNRLLSTDDEELNYECKSCACKFSRPSKLRSHLKICKGSVDVTNLQTNNIEEQEESSVLQSTDQDKRYDCKQCASAFTRQSKLRLHLKTCKGSNEKQAVKVSVRTRSMSEDHDKSIASRKSVEVEQPRKQLKRKLSGQKLRIRIKTRITDESYSKSTADLQDGSDDVSEQQKILQVDGQVYKCKQCKCHFSRESKLRKHMRSHSQKDPYECLKCGCTFSEPCDVIKHLKKHRSDIKSKKKLTQKARDKFIKCTKCGKTYSRMKSIVKHVKAHANRKLHICHICGKTLLTEAYMSQHLKIHKGGQFKCKKCAAKFNLKGQLRQHSKIHFCKISIKRVEIPSDESSVKKPDVPKQDGGSPRNEESQPNRTKRRERRSAVRNDEEVVMGDDRKKRARYKCHVCSKELLTASYMEQHLKTHLGGDFKCVSCEATFTCQQTMDRHSKIHDKSEESHGEDERHLGGKKVVKHFSGKFECFDCSSKFARKSFLRKHLESDCGKQAPDRLSLDDVSVVESRQQSPSGAEDVEMRNENPESSKLSENSISEANSEDADRTRSIDEENKLPNSNREGASSNELSLPMVVKPLTIKFQSKEKDSYTCEMCQRQYEQKSQLIRHINGHANSLRCNQCNKYFIGETSLENHVKTLHDPSRPHACQTCSFRFIRPDHLAKHILLHTNENPTNKPSLDDKERRLNNAGKTIIKHSKVRVKRLKVRNSLSLEDEGKDVEKCHVCFKAFGQKASLVEHLKGHVGTKPYRSIQRS